LINRAVFDLVKPTAAKKNFLSMIDFGSVLRMSGRGRTRKKESGSKKQESRTGAKNQE
jgi:hypothetical protein